jgi:mRNA interferase MazF
VACDAWDVVVVPFPFVEKAGARKRPALALSARSFNEAGSTILAMITTRGHRPWPGDTELTDYQAAGLRVPCLVRLKLFTLDNRLLAKKIGRLRAEDRARVLAELRRYFPRDPS